LCKIEEAIELDSISTGRGAGQQIVNVWGGQVIVQNAFLVIVKKHLTDGDFTGCMKEVKVKMKMNSQKNRML
jgi:hypothetical protein